MDKREHLIKLVENDGMTIKEASSNLKINYSTAKHIVKVFKKTGTVKTQHTIKKKTELFEQVVPPPLQNN